MDRARTLFFVVTIFSVCILPACSVEDAPVSPYGGEEIGPAGGSVSVRGGNFDGLTVEVEPGAWEETWRVALQTLSTFSTPDFPEGLEGYRSSMTGALRLRIGRFDDRGSWVPAPDSLAFTIHFPRGDVVAEGTEAIVAFRWDDDAELWRIRAPERLEDTHLVVRDRRHLPLWTWGKIDFTEAEYDTYVEPAMHELVGQGAWSEIEQTMRDLRDTAGTDPTAVSCQNLRTMQSILAGVRDQAAAGLRAHQDQLGGLCGDCDVTSAEFYELVAKAIRLKVQAWVAELVLIDLSPHWTMTIVGWLVVQGYEGALRNQPCDFGCFFGHGTAGFYSDYALFGIAIGIIELIDLYIELGGVEC